MIARWLRYGAPDVAAAGSGLALLAPSYIQIFTVYLGVPHAFVCLTATVSATSAWSTTSWLSSSAHACAAADPALPRQRGEAYVCARAASVIGTYVRARTRCASSWCTDGSVGCLRCDGACTTQPALRARPARVQMLDGHAGGGHAGGATASSGRVLLGRISLFYI